MKIKKAVRHSNYGFAIILSLGALTILTMIGTAMVLNVLSERRASSNYTAGLKAKYLAEAGVMRAIAELKFGNQGAFNDAIDSLGETALSTGYSNANLLGNRGSYTVTVIDCASRINLNDQNSNARLSQMLQSLSAAISPSPGLTSGECDSIASHRPYAYKEEVMVKANISKTKYNAIANFITVYGYVDPTTVDPQDITTPYAIQPRSPVNVNTAPPEVLRAVLTGIEADHSCPNCGGDGYYFDVLGNHISCPYCGGLGSPGNITGNIVIGTTWAQLLSAYIVTNRPYTSWDAFYGSVKSYFNVPTLSFSSNQEVVLANANPHTGFSWARNAAWASRQGYVGKYIIDWDKNGIIDANDKGLRKSTTEFSFNSGGFYEITSTGTLRDPSGTAVAQRRITIVARVFNTIKVANQAQQDAVGNAMGFDAATSIKSNVVSYPEPVGVNPAAYDGEIMLARVSHSTPNSGNFLRADYTTNFNADGCGGTAAIQDPPNPVSGLHGRKPRIGSVASTNNRGDLMPDGMLVDAHDIVCPDYLPSGNITANAGTLEVWFKPMWNSYDTVGYMDDYQYGYARKIYRFMSKDEIMGSGSLTWPFSTFVFYSQNFGVAKGCSIGAQGYGFFQQGIGWSYYPNKAEGNPEYDIEFSRNYYGNESLGKLDAGSWHQFVLSWKEPPSGGECSPPNTGAWAGSYPNDLQVSMDGVVITNDQNFHHTEYVNNTNYQYLMIGNEWWQGSGATSHFQRTQLNGIIGSARIWDSYLTQAQIANEYGQGFYQKDGTYTSASLMPPAGGQVTWGTINWTGVMPSSEETITMGVDPAGSGTYLGGWTTSGTGQPILDGSGNHVKSGSIKFRANLHSTKGTAAQPDANILKPAADFETGPPGQGGTEAPLPSGWSVEWGTFLRSTVHPHSGTWGARNFWDAAMHYDIPIAGGKSYKFSGWSYVPSGGGTYNVNYILSFDGTGGYNSGEVHVEGWQDQWHQTAIPASGWVTAPADATTARIRLCSWSTGHVSSDFDDLAFIEQGATVLVPLTDTPVLEDVSITYFPKTQILYNKQF